VYYGDSTTTPVTVEQGKSTSHVYAEGTYTVKIVATGINGLTTEVTQTLVVSLRAPENLVVTITNDQVISKKVNVTATADFATMFDVYFGEAGNDTPVSANIGGTASYTYANTGTYTIRLVCKKCCY
jgi:subtilisin-like proprotein convertase family protein